MINRKLQYNPLESPVKNFARAIKETEAKCRDKDEEQIYQEGYEKAKAEYENKNKCKNLGCSNEAIECFGCIQEGQNKLRTELLQDEIKFLKDICKSDNSDYSAIKERISKLKNKLKEVKG